MTKEYSNTYIVIPAFNEETVIESVVTKLLKFFKNVVVVNDGSTDRTKEILEKLNITLISHPFNMGPGSALRTGFNYVKSISNSHSIVTFDADGQHSVEDAVLFAKEINSCKEEIIFGSRFLKHKKNLPFIKIITLKIATIITNLATKTKLSDTHNGLKAFKVSLLGKIDLTLDGYGLDTQIVSEISKKNISYKEMPTNTIYTEYSMKKGQSLMNGLIILEEIFRSKRKK